MRKYLLGLAMTIPVSVGAAHAATMLTFDAKYYQSSPTTSFALPFQGLSGTLYVTGTGMDISTQLNDYQTQVLVQGSGLFAGFDGVATYDGERAGQVPTITITLVDAGLTYTLDLSNTDIVPSYVQGQVFTEQESPSPSNLSGDPFLFLTYTVEKSSDDYYATTAYYTCTTNPCPQEYDITSNTAVVAPASAPVATSVPEPATWTLLVGSLGLTGLVTWRRRALGV